MTYEMVCSSVQGYSHIKSAMPCEDFGVVSSTDAYKIFLVADGHGDSNCPRSAFGSKQMCTIALEKLAEFAEAMKQNDLEDELFDERAERRVRQLIRSMFLKWGITVSEDFANHPLSEEERKGCSHYIARYDKGERIEHIYGTTFIGGLLTEDYLLLLQQGDGRCVVVDEEGKMDMPIPWDDRCFANVCTSVCDTDSIERCRYTVIDIKKHPVAAVFMGSDGVEDSFMTMDQMYTYYRKLLLYCADHSVEQLKEHLDETLPDFSAKGSGDDTTISGIIDYQRIVQLRNQIEQDIRISSIETELRQVQDRLQSMQNGKMEYLEKRSLEEAEKAHTAEEAYQEALHKFEIYQDNLDAVAGVEGKTLSSSLQRNVVTILQNERNTILKSLKESSTSIQILEQQEKSLAKQYEELKEEVRENGNDQRLLEDGIMNSLSKKTQKFALFHIFEVFKKEEKDFEDLRAQYTMCKQQLDEEKRVRQEKETREKELRQDCEAIANGNVSNLSELTRSWLQKQLEGKCAELEEKRKEKEDLKDKACASRDSAKTEYEEYQEKYQNYLQRLDELQKQIAEEKV